MRRWFAAILVALVVPACVAAQAYTWQVKCMDPSMVTEVGTWVDSSAESNIPGACGLGSRSTKDSGAYVEIRPEVPAGNYVVSVCWGVFNSQGGSNKGPNAEGIEYTITDVNGTQNTYLNQRGQNGCSNRNNDVWQPIGVGTFDEDGNGVLRITNTAGNQCFNGPNKRYMNFDAVRLVLEAPTPAKTVTWSQLKTRYRN